MATYYTINMYPVQLKVDYPDDPLDRVSTLLRALYVIPIFVVLAAISSVGISFDSGVSVVGLPQLVPGSVSVIGISFDFSVPLSGLTQLGGLLILPTAIMLLFRNKYPHWWFDFNLALLQFSNRVMAYLFLLTDAYPSSDEEQSIHLDIAYPDTEWGLNRVMPLFKWIFAIPHYVALFFLWIAVIGVSIAAWAAILVTGRYPRSLFDFVVGVMRWQNRVISYAFILVTDSYPPFRLGE